MTDKIMNKMTIGKKMNMSKTAGMGQKEVKKDFVYFVSALFPRVVLSDNSKKKQPTPMVTGQRVSRTSKASFTMNRAAGDTLTRLGSHDNSKNSDGLPRTRSWLSVDPGPTSTIAGYQSILAALGVFVGVLGAAVLINSRRYKNRYRDRQGHGQRRRLSDQSSSSGIYMLD